MTWIILTIIFVLGALAAWAVGGAVRNDAQKNNNDSDETMWARGIGFGIPAIFALIWFIMTIAMSLHQVPAGHVGIVYTFGKITGQRDAGFQMTAPWQSLTQANTQVQTLCFFDDAAKCPDGATEVAQGLDSFSKETQNVYIDAVLNIEVSPDEVQSLYTTVGSNYINKLIPGRIAQIFKDETVNYAAVDIAPNRELIRANVEGQLRKEMAPYSINVSALLLENITFDFEFENAITAKQVAAQEALKQEQLVAAERFKADQQIEAARGEAGRLQVTAEGQAAANNAIAASLTPALIQFQAIQKLADNVQIALIPSGQGVIIDPTTLFGKTEGQ